MTVRDEAWTIERLTSAAELDVVLAIEQESFSNPWTKDMYLAELGHEGISYCYVIRSAAGDVVGFCSFWRVLEELHINNLAVTPAARGRGAGTTLLRHVLREGARLGAHRATLEVRRSNDAAQRLYARLGFSVAGVRRAYYSNPIEDALVLWREGLSGA